MNATEKRLSDLLGRFDKEYGHFPDGRIDYTNRDYAPVLTIFVEYDGKILLLKRSDKVHTYTGAWMTVAGYIDDHKSLKDKIIEEAGEELKIEIGADDELHIGQPWEFTDEKIGKTWAIFPAIIRFAVEPTITLDWEHSEHKWIKPEEIEKHETVPNLATSYKQALI